MTCRDPYARQWARHYDAKRRQGRENAKAAADPERQKRTQAIIDSVAEGVTCISVDVRRKL